MSTLPGRPKLLSLSYFDLLAHYAQRQKDRGQDVFCLQIGANDGKINDPVHPFIRDYGWKGLLVEPQYDVFHNGLCKTYEGFSNVILENVALGTQEGNLPFYRVSVSRSRWATGLSGFNKEPLLKHVESGLIARLAREEGAQIPDDPSRLIEEVSVPTTTFKKLMAKHDVRKIDVLCIDTEGYDYEILKLIDFDTYKPDLVFFEHVHLSDKDYAEAVDLLRRHGYRVYYKADDTLAIRFALPLKTWAKLRTKALLGMP